MRKLSFTLMLVFVLNCIMAQTGKDTWLLGGNAGFSSQKQGSTTTYLNFSPNAGYFVINDLAIGGLLSYTSIKPEGYDAISSFSFSPFVRYYFLPLGSGAKLFGNGSFGFGSAKQSGTSESFTTWSLSAGPAIFLNQNTALEIALSYGSMKYKNDPDAINTFGINIGFQVHLNCCKTSAKK